MSVDLSKLLTPGVIAGFFSIASAAAAVAGNAQLAKALSDPSVVQALTLGAGALAVVAGALPGVGHKS